MDFRKKMRLRLYLALAYAVIGIAMIVAANLTAADNFLSAFGIALVVVGGARLRNYFRITKDEKTLRRQEVAETDERNLSIMHRARSLSFSIYVLAACCGVIVLHLLGKAEYGTPLGMSVCALLVIYWISYWVLQKRS